MKNAEYSERAGRLIDQDKIGSMELKKRRDISSGFIKNNDLWSVDDGKSTLLGRLIHETGNIYKDQSRYLESFTDNSEMDYSLLLDGLIDEKDRE